MGFYDSGRVKTAIARLHVYLQTYETHREEQRYFLLSYLESLRKDCELAEQHGSLCLIADIEQELLELEEYLSKELLRARLVPSKRELN